MWQLGPQEGIERPFSAPARLQQAFFFMATSKEKYFYEAL
jgi:hypothetical protein